MAVATVLAGCNQDSVLSVIGTAPTAKPPARTPSAVSATGFATVSWVAPTQNVDGSALTNLAGYRVRYGLSVGRLAKTAGVPNAGTTSIRIEGLTAGTWYFTVAAYTNVGVEGAQSAAVSKTIR